MSITGDGSRSDSTSLREIETLAKTAVQAIGWCVNPERGRCLVAAETIAGREGAFLCN
jgi:hypothetical protein